MKKIYLITSLLILSITGFSASRDTTIYEASTGNSAIIRIEDDGSYTGLSVNRVSIPEEANRSAMMCMLDKKMKCCKDLTGCAPACCGLAACEISWYAACLFDWFRTQKPKP